MANIDRSFFDQLTTDDLVARSATSQSEYYARYMSSLRPYSQSDIDTLNLTASFNCVYPFLAPGRINKNSHTINITTTSDPTIELGLPHTMHNTVIMTPSMMMKPDIIIHECVHIFVREYMADSGKRPMLEQMFAEYGYYPYPNFRTLIKPHPTYPSYSFVSNPDELRHTTFMKRVKKSQFLNIVDNSPLPYTRVFYSYAYLNNVRRNDLRNSLVNFNKGKFAIVSTDGGASYFTYGMPSNEHPFVEFIANELMRFTYGMILSVYDKFAEELKMFTRAQLNSKSLFELMDEKIQTMRLTMTQQQIEADPVAGPFLKKIEDVAKFNALPNMQHRALVQMFARWLYEAEIKFV